MFNFIFDGKIGEMLAPVVPSNQLFLAIQHHKNLEVQNMVLMTTVDITQLSDGGVAAIHVASRYNNRFALELLLSRGISVNFADRNGNTPLHFAAQYGHMDLCKFLIEKGSSTASKNNKNQSPYDVATNHLIRQYLLPLLMQAERTIEEQGGEAVSSYATNYMFRSNASLPTTMTGPPPSGIPPPTAQVPPGPYGQVPAYPATPYSSVPAAPGGQIQPSVDPIQQQTGLSGPPQFAPPQLAPPAAGSGAPYQVPSYNSGGNVRAIKPDGFHSSASDPALQQKYGHTKISHNIAPPPTSFPAAPPTYAAPLPATGSVYSRYVPYDAHTNSAAPLPFPANPQVVSVPLPTPSQPQVSNVGPPLHLKNPNFPPAGPPPAHIPGGIPGGVSPSVVTPPSAGRPQGGLAAAPTVASLNPGMIVFDPSADCDIVTADSGSSAVL